MGYTHYWYRSNANTDPARFAAFVDDCRKVCSALPIPLGDAGGEAEPVFNADLVAFNGHVNSASLMPQVAKVDGLKWPAPKAEGVADWQTQSADAGNWFAGPVVSTRTLPESGNGSYESFIVNAKAERCFDCCKTNFHPYDLAVQCCLVALKEHFGQDVAIRSDGDADAWKEAADICQHVLGYGLAFELDDRAACDRLDSAWTAAEQVAEAAERKVKFGDYPPVPDDRNATIKAIRQSLRQRTGRDWSVKGDRGTAWGWLTISAPPKRCKWQYRDTGRKDHRGMPEYEEYWDATKDYGYMGHADRETLRKALGLSQEVHGQGVSVMPNARTEYFDRAAGREPRSYGERDWD